MYTIDKPIQQAIKQEFGQYVHIYWTSTTCDDHISVPLDYFSGKAKYITFVKAYMTTTPYMLSWNAPSGSSTIYLTTHSIIINWDGDGTLCNTSPYDSEATISTEFMSFPFKVSLGVYDHSITDDNLTTQPISTELKNPSFPYIFPINNNKAALKFWIKYNTGNSISASLNKVAYKSDFVWQFHLIMFISN